MNAPNYNTIVIDFCIAFVNGSLETSRFPSMPSGLGPKIKKVTAREITIERM